MRTYKQYRKAVLRRSIKSIPLAACAENWEFEWFSINLSKVSMYYLTSFLFYMTTCDKIETWDNLPLPPHPKQANEKILCGTGNRNKRG